MEGCDTLDVVGLREHVDRGYVCQLVAAVGEDTEVAARPRRNGTLRAPSSHIFNLSNSPTRQRDIGPSLGAGAGVGP